MIFLSCRFKIRINLSSLDGKEQILELKFPRSLIILLYTHSNYPHKRQHRIHNGCDETILIHGRF